MLASCGSPRWGRRHGYGGCRPSCTCGRPGIPAAGSMICWPRRCVRAGWRPALGSQSWRAEDSLIREMLVRAGAVLTTTGRPGTARRGGSGKRDEKVYERNQRVKLRKRRADSNLADLGRCVVHARRANGKGDSVAGMDRRAGRSWGKPAAYLWRGGRGIAGHLPRRSVPGERGNDRRLPSLRSLQGRDGQARRQLMAAGWGGGFVVVGGRESRPHGEGSQQASSGNAGMPGVRR